LSKDDFRVNTRFILVVYSPNMVCISIKLHFINLGKGLLLDVQISLVVLLAETWVDWQLAIVKSKRREAV
jgi:hypothetical protein